MATSTAELQELETLLLAPFQALVKFLSSPEAQPLLEGLNKLQVQFNTMQKTVQATATIVAQELAPMTEGLKGLGQQLDTLNKKIEAVAKDTAETASKVSGDAKTIVLRVVR